MIKFGIIGLGSISRFYINAIENNADSRLVAICDNDKSRKQQFSQYTFFNDYVDMLTHAGLDAVVVSVPNAVHFPIIKQAMKHNIKVICEKPLCLNYQQTKAIYTLARKKKAFIYTAFHRRINKNLSGLFSIPSSRMKFVYVRYWEKIEDHTSGTWVYDKDISGGGCVIDNGINVIDLLLRICGDIKLLNARIEYGSLKSYKVDTRAIVVFSFKDGNAVMDLDWNYPGEVKDITVFRSDGGVETADMINEWQEFKGSLVHEYDGIIEDFLLEARKSDFFLDEYVVRAAQLVDEIYKQYRPDKPQRINQSHR